MNNNTRIRYTFSDEHKRFRKNTLITEKVDDLLFFGISRCNTEVNDAFDKVIGRNTAELRLNHAKMTREHYDKLLPQLPFYVSANGLWGWCPVTKVKNLLYHFDNIDDLCANEHYDRHHMNNHYYVKGQHFQFCDKDPPESGACLCTHEDISSYKEE